MGTEAQPGKIACPHCQALIKVPALAPRSQVSCPKCGQGFRLGETVAVESRKPKAESRLEALPPPPPIPKSQIPNHPRHPLPPPPPSPPPPRSQAGATPPVASPA